MRERRVGGVWALMLSDLEGDSDLLWGRNTLANGSIGNLAPGDVTVELV
jgi:hypothetical protein